MTNSSYFITRAEDFRKLLAAYPTTRTGITCLECFTEICRTILEGGFSIYACDCYSRGFEPGKPASLTDKAWQEFIKRSSGYKFLSAINDNRIDNLALSEIVNPSPLSSDDCWCPACASNRKLAGKGFWVSAQGLLVCIYGVCQDCMQRVGSLSTEDQTREIDLVTNRLSRRYPFLQGDL
jgi:hypothetical protein